MAHNTSSYRKLYSGKYRCSLIAKRDIVGGIELCVEVNSGTYAGYRIRFAALGQHKMVRAAGLAVGQAVDVFLRYKRGKGGVFVPVVTNFHATQMPTVVTVLAGRPPGDNGEPTLWPVSYNRPSVRDEQDRMRLYPAHKVLSPYTYFPEELENDLRSELDLEEAECDGCLESATEDRGRYWPDRVLDRMAHDHPLCLLGNGEITTRITNFDTTFARYCRCEAQSSADGPVLVSAYQYGREVVSHAQATGGVSPDYRCPVWARWLHVRFPADEDPEATLTRCRQFVTAVRRLGLCKHKVLPFTLGNGDLEVMFSGAPVFCLARPGFEYVAGYLCRIIADWSPYCDPEIGQGPRGSWWIPNTPQPIDTSLYVPQAMVAMPNTQVGQTGKYKVRVSLHELFNLDANAVAAIAAVPRPFNPPPWHEGPQEIFLQLWEHAVAIAVCRSQSVDQVTAGNRWVYPDTFDFMFCGADGKAAHERLFAAAMNMLDFGCPFALLEALLAPAAFMSGIPKAKVKSTLDNAIQKSRQARPLPIEVWEPPEDDDDIWIEA